MLVSRTADAQITLDGNPNDWPAVLSNPAIPFKLKIVDSFNTDNDDVFKGSSKDVNDIPGWQWELQAANDKTDIENAGLALIGSKLYFFGDRYSNSGTCAMGFWLLKNDVRLTTATTPFSFTDVHAEGDVLVTMNFTGGGGVASRHVYKWVSGGLVEVTLSTAAADVKSNDSAVASPWPYTPKGSGDPINVYQSPTFMEGFVDLDSLGAEVDFCFADFFISTRTSFTTTSVLEDIVAGRFATRPIVTVANDTVCAGQPAQFVAETFGGLRPIQWSWNDTVSYGGDSTFTINPATVDTFVWVIARGANGCLSVPDTALLIVKPVATVDTIPNFVYCNGAAGSAITFTSTPGGSTFNWTSSADVGFGTSGTGGIGSFTATNTGTTPIVATVSVTATRNTCGGPTRVFTITVNPTPNVAAHGDSTYCNGDAAAGYSFSGGVAGTSFSWTSSANVGFGTAGTGNIGAFSATNNGTSAIVATVVVTPSANGCTGAADTFLVTVNPTPNVAAHGDSTYCAGVLAGGLNFTGSIGGTTFNWTSTTDVGFGTSGAGNIAAYVAVNAGVVPVVATVVVTPSANGCSGTPDTFLITVNPNGAVNPVPNREHCNGDAATSIVFSSAVPGTTFTWASSLNVGFGTSGTGNIGAYAALNAGTTPVVATVTVTPSASGCGSGAINFMVTVNPTPTVAAHGDSTYCAGVLAGALNFSGAVGGTSFIWTSTADVGFGTAGTGNIAAYVALNAGLSPVSATVVVIPVANGCPGVADTFVITVNPNPSINPVSNRSHCAGDGGSAITFSGSLPGILFSWTSSVNVGFGTGGTGSIGGYTALNGGSTPIVATVTVTPSVAGCGSGAIQFMVTVNPTPNVAAHGDSLYCKGIIAPGLSFTGLPGTTFAWTSSANVGFGTSGTGDIAPYLTLNPGGVNLVATVIVTPSLNGCTGVADTFIITVKPGATVPEIPNRALCSKAVGAMINITGGDIINTFTWVASTNVGFGTSGTGNIGGFVAINNPGPANIVATVTVTVVGAGGCAGSSRDFTVTVYPKPYVVARDTTVCAGTSLNLTPLGTPAGGTWSGPGVSGNTFNMGIAGTYKIYYNKTNTAGCSGYDSAYICVTNCCVVYGTYTQGVWGSCYGTVCDGKTNCSGRKTPVQLINYLLNLGGQITVGRPGRSIVIPTYAAATVNAVLPGSYGPNKLTYPGNVTISNVAGSIFANNYLSGGKLKNSLLGEQIAMKLNIRMTPGIVNFPIVYTPGGDSYFQTFQANEVCCKFTCDDKCPICFCIKKSVAKYLTKGGTQAANLNSLVNLADDLLGGTVTPGQVIGGYTVPSYADVAAALGTISSAFNYFRTFNGGYGCTSAKGAVASGTTPEMPTIETQTRIYPNPTTGAFTIEVPAIDKDAHIMVLDINGRVLFKEVLPANPYDQKLQLQMPDVARGMYFIRIETNGSSFTKKLMLE